MRVLSGINPSSSKGLHLGNYIGAVKPHIEFQKEAKECLYFVANLHSLNSVYDKETLLDNTRNIIAQYLAFGLNLDKTVFFVESDILEIPYLQTILNNLTTVSQMKRMHAYKDKLADPNETQESLNVGLFNYPILMAADILLFKPDVVPVGDDQKQHVEVARDIAQNFNRRYGKFFKVPDVHIHKTHGRILGIDGQRKMGKSLGNDLPIFADKDMIKKQIMKITTDPARIKSTDPGDPKKNVCFKYLEYLDFDQKALEEMKDQYKTGSIGDKKIKEILLDLFLEYFKNTREKYKELSKDPSYIEKVQKNGAQKSREIAQKNLSEIKKLIGLAK